MFSFVQNGLVISEKFRNFLVVTLKSGKFDNVGFIFEWFCNVTEDSVIFMKNHEGQETFKRFCFVLNFWVMLKKVHLCFRRITKVWERRERFGNV